MLWSPSLCGDELQNKPSQASQRLPFVTFSQHPETKTSALNSRCSFAFTVFSRSETVNHLLSALTRSCLCISSSISVISAFWSVRITAKLDLTYQQGTAVLKTVCSCRKLPLWDNLSFFFVHFNCRLQHTQCPLFFFVTSRLALCVCVLPDSHLSSSQSLTPPSSEWHWAVTQPRSSLPTECI